MANNHFRSISLPSTCHPISAQFDEHLIRLISSNNTTTSCSSISEGVNTLLGLYDCVDELLLRPANQKVITRNSQSKWVDDILEGSLRLLDVCGVGRDALLSMKENLQGVQSLLRRSSGELTVRKGVSEYIKCRKKVKKGIRQCLKNMKKNERVDRKNYSVSIDSIFRQVEVITDDNLKSLLRYIAGVKSQRSKGKVSLVVRLVKEISGIDKARSGSEFEDIDAQLRSLISRKKTSFGRRQVENVRCRMGELESKIEELVDELECLFRHLVKTRVTLLNLLSN